MSVALFEAVTGSFANGDPVTDFGSEETRIHSVADHLTRLFNTRRGTLPHDPEYGLPDMGEIYQGLPNTVQGFKRALAELVKRYEPRVDRVDCRVEQVSADEFRLQAVLSFRLLEGRAVKLRALFSSSGRAEVNSSAARR